MFGSEILDVAIGLSLVYLLLSLLASAVREAIESVTKRRARTLAAGVRELLGGDESAALCARLYEHPLLFCLYRGSYAEASQARVWGILPSSGLPSYIPSRSFALALMDTVARGDVDDRYAVHQTGPALTIQNLRSALGRLESPRVRRALLSAIDSANGDLATAQRNVEAWFDSAMDRVSGWYRRRTQAYLFLIGLAITLAVNANTVTLANHLANNKAAREMLVASAQAVSERERAAPGAVLGPGDTTAAVANVRQRYAELAALKLPIGWNETVPHPGRGDPSGSFWNDWVLQIVGLLVTAFAVMLGAPFWFDLLNKVMVIRSTVKPHEKSPEEDSEDRQRPRAERQAPVVAPVVAAPASAAPSAAVPVAAASGAAAGVATVGGGGGGRGDDGDDELPVAFEPRVWADGDDEGIL